MVGISHTTLGEAGTVPNAFLNSESEKMVRSLAWAHGFDELASDLRHMAANGYEQCRHREIRRSAGTLILKAVEGRLLTRIPALEMREDFDDFYFDYRDYFDHPDEYFSKIVGEWRSWPKRSWLGDKIGRIWTPVPGILSEISPDVFDESRFEGRDDDWHRIREKDVRRDASACAFLSKLLRQDEQGRGRIEVEYDSDRNLQHTLTDAGTETREVPRWDEVKQELTYRGVTRTFAGQAKNLRVVFAAFEKQNWQELISDPLPEPKPRKGGKDPVDPVERVQSTCDSHNERFPTFTLHSRRGGTCFLWKSAELPANSE